MILSLYLLYEAHLQAHLQDLLMHIRAMVPYIIRDIMDTILVLETNNVSCVESIIIIIISIKADHH